MRDGSERLRRSDWGLLRGLVLGGVLLAAAYFFLMGIQPPYLMTDINMADATRALLASIALLIFALIIVVGTKSDDL
jgi:hypothetical protein